MKVLMLSTDRRIFDEHSSVRKRMISYGSIFDQLHLIVVTRRRDRHKTVQLAPNVWAYPTSSRLRLLAPFGALSIARKELCIYGTFTPDIVSAQDPFETGLMGWLIARRYRRKLQLQLHTDLFSPYFIEAQRFNRLRRSLARFLLRRAQCVRVVTERAREELLRRYPRLAGRIFVLPIFVDVSFFEKTEPAFDLHGRYPQFSFIMLMVGRLAREKDIPLALAALAEVCRHHPRAGLVIVGEGPERSRLRARAKELGIERSVVIEPWQKREDLVSYYKTANLFLLTSRYEGYNLALIEAAASGIPIVSSDVGIAPVLSSKSGALICPVGDRDCFVEKIVSVMGSPERRLFARLNEEARTKGLIAPSEEAYLSAYRQMMEFCFAIPEHTEA